MIFGGKQSLDMVRYRYEWNFEIFSNLDFQISYGNSELKKSTELMETNNDTIETFR